MTISGVQKNGTMNSDKKLLTVKLFANRSDHLVQVK